MFRRTTRSRFRHSTPLAHKQRFWIQVVDSQTETNGVVTTFTLMNWANVPAYGSMGALSKGVKVLRILHQLKVTPIATREVRTFGVNLDDATDVGANAWDPSSASSANQRIPDRVFRWGSLDIGASASFTAGLSPYSGVQDYTRDYAIKTFMKPDKVIFFSLSPAAAAGNQLTITSTARVLIEIG